MFCKTLLAVILAAALPISRSSISRQREAYTVSVDVDLVLLNVRVLYKNGEVVRGLKQDDFKVYEDGRLQDLTLFVGQDAPATIGLVVDSSGSMTPKWRELQRAVATFGAESNPRDEMFIVEFNDQTHWPLPAEKPFTNDVEEIERVMRTMFPFGRTALYDATASAFGHVQKGQFDRKILVILSDGADNASVLDLDHLLEIAQQANVTLYTIGFYNLEAEDRNPKVLKRLASATGGQAYFPENETQLHDAWRRIANGIRMQYTLGYYPVHRGDGTFRKLRVMVANPRGERLLIQTRPGYFARRGGLED